MLIDFLKMNGIINCKGFSKFRFNFEIVKLIKLMKFYLFE
jgi:hypothetical protein